MKTLRWALAVSMFTLAAAAASAMDQDIRELQARLAAQEARMAEQDARLNDLQAKLTAGGAGGDRPESMVSLQKNAVVSIGGLVTTKYTHTTAKADSAIGPDDSPRPYGRLAESRSGNLALSDAELSMQIDVNDHFDAFLNIDLHNGAAEDYASAAAYFVRWKNICDTGFGLKVGRDQLVFGEGGWGELGSYAAGSGDGIGDLDFGFADGRSVIISHNVYDVTGVTQITPYWESSDGKIVAELSFIQNINNTDNRMNSGVGGSTFTRDQDGVLVVRSRNYGLGSMSGRLAYTPLEGLKLSASLVNYRSNGSDDLPSAFATHNKNNTALGLAVNYTPAFFDRLSLWAQWIHGWNVDHMDGYRSDAVNFGAAFNLTDNLTVFMQGDYLRASHDQHSADQDFRGTAWAAYGGVQYSLPYGAYLEAGWKHEWVKHQQNGAKLLKARADTIYGLLGFEF